MALKADQYGLIVTSDKTEWSNALKEWVEISDDIEEVKKILSQSFSLQKKTFNYQRRAKHFTPRKTSDVKPKKPTQIPERKDAKASPVSQVKWYKRILSQISFGNKDNHKWNKKQDKKLRDIKNKPTGSKGISKLLGGILLGITLLGGKIAKGLLARAVFGVGGGMVLRGLSYVLGGGDKDKEKSKDKGRGKGFWGKGLSKFKDSKLLRKIPWLGALFSGSAIALSELSTEKTRSEKNKVIGGELGRGAGAMTGMVAGAMAGSVIPVVGTIIGGIIGGWFGADAGKILGEKASEFFDSDVWDSIKDLHAKAVDLMSKGFELASKGADKVKELHEGAVNVTSNVMTFFGNARQKAINAVSDGLTSVSTGYKQAKTKTSNLIDSVTGKVTGRGGASSKGVKQLLEQISLGEGTGGTEGYDTTFSYGKWDDSNRKPLTKMTLAEVKAHQRTMINNQKKAGKGINERSSATGKYQFISKTLRNTQNSLGISDDAIFTPELQDKMAEHLARKSGGLNRYLRSKKTRKDEKTLTRSLSSQWSSIANPETGVSSHTFGGRRQNSVNGLGNLSGIYKGIGTQVATVSPKVSRPNMPILKPLVVPQSHKKQDIKARESKVANTIIQQESGRDVPDRNIAHAITGGVSS